ncbi:MAG: carbohydrate ABC transporter permease [Chloroflexi bacterium]|nr:carbohydrate ABC transporter permease [Chloroflexota bacterium]
MAATSVALRGAIRHEVSWWDRLKQPFFYAILIGWAILSIAPFYLSVVFSLKPVQNIYDKPLFWPQPFTLDNYAKIITQFEYFPQWLLNSTIVAVFLCLVRTLFCAMGGYAFARMKFPGKNLLFTAMLVSMMIPGQVTIITNFLIIGPRVFHLIDNLWAVILPGITTAFGVFMMTQFFKSIPKDLEEAAYIDGADRFTVFFRLILPLSQTSLITLALFTFQGEWNAFMWPLIVLRTPTNFTLPLGLQWFKGEYYSLYSIILAGSLFNALPIIIIFFLFQRFFIQSIATTGLKGV